MSARAASSPTSTGHAASSMPPTARRPSPYAPDTICSEPYTPPSHTGRGAGPRSGDPRRDGRVLIPEPAVMVDHTHIAARRRPVRHARSGTGMGRLSAVRGLRIRVAVAVLAVDDHHDRRTDLHSGPLVRQTPPWSRFRTGGPRRPRREQHAEQPHLVEHRRHDHHVPMPIVAGVQSQPAVRPTAGDRDTQATTRPRTHGASPARHHQQRPRLHDPAHRPGKPQ